MSEIDTLLFFFSSRRRHTRWPRDWSSYVCSSDLFTVLPAPRVRNCTKTSTPSRSTLSRSEERRVGKECRWRWSAEHGKKRERKGGIGGQRTGRGGRGQEGRVDGERRGVRTREERQ